jgi:hypothetical protein
LIVDYESGSSPNSTIRARLIAGRNSGAWNGNGITSSTAATNTTLYAMGYFDNNEVPETNPDYFKTTFAGQTVDETSILIKFTYAGDTNLDGMVTIIDNGQIGTFWQQTNKEWWQGDVNYSGNVDIADLGIVATNWQAGAPGNEHPQLRPSGGHVGGGTRLSISDLILHATDWQQESGEGGGAVAARTPGGGDGDDDLTPEEQEFFAGIAHLDLTEPQIAWLRSILNTSRSPAL